MTTDGAPLGHIKIARKAFDRDSGDPFWLEHRVFSRWEAWVDVIQLASYADGNFRTSHGVLTLARGEFVASRRHLAKRWKWTEKRVRVFVEHMLKTARVRAQRETHDGMVYLIEKYDYYQSALTVGGPQKGPAKGHRGAQQGPKIEAVKAIEALTTVPNERLVLRHYLATHPSRRLSEKSASAVARALAMGFTAAELCDAIDGNAGDEWHRNIGKQGITYVLRSAELIDDFRARKEATTPRSAVDPSTGLPNDIGLGVIVGGRKHVV